jgi:TonB family protein
VGSVLGAIGAGISSGTSIEAFGPGGEATADYAQFVEFFYRRAWSQPAEVDDDLATVKATVVIRRDGTVESFRITKRSGNATLDNSVQRLENLRSVEPFPEGARDERRTFVLNFNLKAEP